MEATDILYEEHRIITMVLECLQKIVEEAEESGKLNAQSAQAAIDFFRNFADACHHAKEEDRLFEVMQEHGLPRDGGPIGVMLTEHDEGRKHVRGMAQAVQKAATGDAQALSQFAENARDFIALLTAHINKEDQVLFPMAGQVIASEAANTLLADFKRIEAEAGGRRHVEHIQIARQLCAQYRIAFVDDAQIQTIRDQFDVNYS